MVSVVLAGLFGMMRGVVAVPFGDVRVVARLFMIASLMMFGGGAMVFGGEFVVLRPDGPTAGYRKRVPQLRPTYWHQTLDVSAMTCRPRKGVHHVSNVNY